MQRKSHVNTNMLLDCSVFYVHNATFKAKSLVVSATFHNFACNSTPQR